MRVALAVALFGLASGCVSQDKLRAQEAEAAKYKTEVEQLKAQVSNSKAELDAERKRAAELQGKVDELASRQRSLESAKAELEKKSAEYERMASALRGQIDAGRVELTELRGKMTVKMKDKILFSSGSATIGKEGKEALKAVADVLKGVQGRVIRVEGHTDNVPTGRGPLASNWDLSTTRALAVVRFMQESGVDPKQLAAAGYCEFQPIASNDTPEGRSLNRRIEIVLAAGEPPPEAPPPAP